MVASIRKRCLLGSALAALFTHGTALAQSNDAAESAEEGLGEIVVTATKRSENIQKVPIAVSALTGDQLAKQGVANVTGIASQVPNLQIAMPYSDAIPIFSLRGISAVDYAQNQSSPVGLYVDEDYKGVSVFTSLQLFDVERVEVLRGPQGTLFGKNTTGGAVSVTTKSADVSAGFTGNITAGYGRFDRFEILGGINIPLIDDKLAARIAFTRTKADGFVKNLAPGLADLGSIDDWAVRASVTANPTDRLKLELRYTHSESTPLGYGVLAEDIGPGGVGFTGYDRSGLGFFESEVDTVGFLDIRNDSASMRLNWDISNSATLTSVTTYNTGRWLTKEDADGSPFNILTSNYASDAKAFSQDLRITSTDNVPLKWLVGAYFYRDSVEYGVTTRYYYTFAGDNNINGQLDCFDDGFTGCAYSNDLRQVRNSFAIYTHNDYRFDNGLTITAGLRYTHDDNRLDRYNAWLGFLDPATGQEDLRAAPTISGTPAVNRLKSSNLSGKLGVSYETKGGTLFYASASRGYRGGAFNGQAAVDPSEITIARPELLYAYEVGAKMQTTDRKLRLNTAAFFYDYRNQQFLDVSPNSLVILYNAPKSHLWGLEAELMAQPAPKLGARLGLSYLNSKYKDNTLQGQDLSGNALIVAPEWTLNGGIDWDIVDSSIGKVSLHTDSRYTSRLYFDAFNSRTVSQQGYWVHDARLSYAPANDAFEIAAWIRNIGNKKYKVYKLELLELYNYNYSMRGRPREFGVQASFRF